MFNNTSFWCNLNYLRCSFWNNDIIWIIECSVVYNFGYVCFCLHETGKELWLQAPEFNKYLTKQVANLQALNGKLSETGL